MFFLSFRIFTLYIFTLNFELTHRLCSHCLSLILFFVFLTCSQDVMPTGVALEYHWSSLPSIRCKTWTFLWEQQWWVPRQRFFSYEILLSSVIIYECCNKAYLAVPCLPVICAAEVSFVFDLMCLALNQIRSDTFWAHSIHVLQTWHQEGESLCSQRLFGENKMNRLTCMSQSQIYWLLAGVKTVKNIFSAFLHWSVSGVYNEVTTDGFRLIRHLAVGSDFEFESFAHSWSHQQRAPCILWGNFADEHWRDLQSSHCFFSSVLLLCSQNLGPAKTVVWAWVKNQMKQDHGVQGSFQSAEGIYRKYQNKDCPFSLVPHFHITLLSHLELCYRGRELSGVHNSPFTVLPPMTFSYQSRMVSFQSEWQMLCIMSQVAHVLVERLFLAQHLLHSVVLYHQLLSISIDFCYLAETWQ